jgi:hypothetical protein
VSPGDDLFVEVGGVGQCNGAGPAGADPAGLIAGNGGGASDVRTISLGFTNVCSPQVSRQDLVSLGSRLIVAAGGGGAGGPGVPGTGSGAAPGGGGGDAGLGGGQGASEGGGGGGPGGGSTGGSPGGGGGFRGTAGGPGSLLAGGAGGICRGCEVPGGGGGGGGGGLYGGGGGGGGDEFSGGGGGGGGASLVPLGGTPPNPVTKPAQVSIEYPDQGACNGRKATLAGTDDDDVLVGTRGRDVIRGGPGDDKIRGRGGGDVCAGPAATTPFAAAPAATSCEAAPAATSCAAAPGTIGSWEEPIATAAAPARDATGHKAASAAGAGQARPASAREVVERGAKRRSGARADWFSSAPACNRNAVRRRSHPAISSRNGALACLYGGSDTQAARRAAKPEHGDSGRVRRW